MVPIRLGSVAILKMMRAAGLNDTLTALILVYIAQGLPMAIFILSEFVQQIPKDLRDAARCDGVPETRIFFEVIAPLLRPAIATVAVFTIVPIWNDLWFPLILTSRDTTHTITLGVQQFLGQYITDWNSVLAALSMAILPVVAIYVIFSRQLISGLTAGAVEWPETRIFFEVIAPLLRPAIATVAVFTIVPIWNDLWFPLILTSSDSTHTITLGVQQFLGQYITDWNAVLAALSMAILPVVAIYVIFSRQLISGLTAGAVK